MDQVIMLLSAVLMVSGLGLTAIGALLTARAVVVTYDQAKALSGTFWGGNDELKERLLDQSRRARYGLRSIVAGSVLQATGVALPLIQMI